MKRAKADALANSRPYQVFRSGKQVADCPAAEIRVGDLVQVNDDDEIPCDLLLLRTADVVTEGVAYLETSNLDGETDLKTRRARVETAGLTVSQLTQLRGRFECEPPNADLYRFDAKLSLPRKQLAESFLFGTASGGGVLLQEDDLLGNATGAGADWGASPVATGHHEQQTDDGARSASTTSTTAASVSSSAREFHGGNVDLPISGEQLLQHGTVLRKTGCALGLVVYTGGDTKLSQNKNTAPTKVSSADKRINQITVGIFSAQLLLVLFLGLAGHSWAGNGNAGYWYLGWPPEAADRGSIETIETHSLGEPEGTHVDGASGSTMLGGDTAPLASAWHRGRNLQLGASAQTALATPLATIVGELVNATAAAIASTADEASSGAATPHGRMLGLGASGAAGSGHGGLHVPHGQPWYAAWVLPLRFLLLSSMMIPISLKVSLDIVKIFYARLIANDLQMYDEASDTPAAVANTSVGEDLGCLHAVLTDKTGTLTENIMTLCAVSIGGEVYGRGASLDTGSSHGQDPNGQRASSATSLQHDLADARLLRALAESRPQALDFFRALALCNTVKPEHVNAVPLSPGQELWSSQHRRGLSHRRTSSYRSAGGSGSVSPTNSSAAASGDAGIATGRRRGSSVMKLIAARDDDDVDGDVNGGSVPTSAGTPPRTPERLNTRRVSFDASASVADGSAFPIGAPTGAAAPSSAHHLTPARVHMRRRCVQYASSSPDEEALVHAAAKMGVALLHRRVLAGGVQRVSITYEGAIVGCGADARSAAAAGETYPEAVEASLDAIDTVAATDDDPTSKRVWVSDANDGATYDILNVLPFTSDRRRMSVIVRKIDGGLGSGNGGGNNSSRSNPSISTGQQHQRGRSASATSSWSIEGRDLVLITKGADDVIRPLLARAHSGSASDTLDQMEDHLESFATKGLRTLVIAARPVSQKEYDGWRQRWDAACSEVGAGREAAVASACELMERDLHLLGATAIEDKLQEGVPETIRSLKQTGISVFMVTGDKHSTAVQIGRSCGLISGPPATDSEHRSGGAITPVDGPQSLILSIRGHTPHDVDAELSQAVRMHQETVSGHSDVAVSISMSSPIKQAMQSIEGSHSSTPSASAALELAGADRGAPTEVVLVVEGCALRHILSDARHADTFTTLALSCDSVICCRCTPAQKAALVSCVRAQGRTTLAIGDGGNDVAMIQAANVGVGISGREGLQAARASDYSVARFKHLVPLVLVHGRYSAYRTALISGYTIYKSMALAFVQLLANTACGYSGCSLLDTYALTTYNMVYTAVPGLFMALDMDRSVSQVMMQPHHYKEAARGDWYAPWTFVVWSLRASYQAVVVYLCMVWGVGGLHGLWPSSAPSPSGYGDAPAGGAFDGSSADIGVGSGAVFTTLIFVQFVTMSSEMRGITGHNHAINFACFVLYALLMALRNSWPASSASLGTLSAMLHPDGFASVAVVALAVVAAAGPFVAWRAWERTIWAPATPSVDVPRAVTDAATKGLASVIKSARKVSVDALTHMRNASSGRDGNANGAKAASAGAAAPARPTDASVNRGESGRQSSVGAMVGRLRDRLSAEPIASSPDAEAGTTPVAGRYGSFILPLSNLRDGSAEPLLRVLSDAADSRNDGGRQTSDSRSANADAADEDAAGDDLQGSDGDAHQQMMNDRRGRGSRLLNRSTAVQRNGTGAPNADTSSGSPGGQATNGTADAVAYSSITQSGLGSHSKDPARKTRYA